MSRSKRVIGVLSGMVMFLVGGMFFFLDMGICIVVMLSLIQIGMTIRGMRTMYYYLTMARFMVGGKNVLYRSLILLDLGTVAGSLVEHEMIYAVIYLAFLHFSAGVISAFRANESRNYGSRWRLKMAYGVTNILISIAVIAGAAVFKQPLVMIYIYGAGLMYSGVLRIASAFRRTSIVFIQ